MLSRYLRGPLSVIERLANHAAASSAKERIKIGLLETTNLTAAEIDHLDTILSQPGRNKRQGFYFDGQRDLAAIGTEQVRRDVDHDGGDDGKKGNSRL